MSEQETQQCPTCQGKGYNMVDRAAEYNTYSDGTGIPLPQRATVTQPENCTTCAGNGFIQGGSR